MIETKHLFSILDEKLISLLSSLDEADWEKPTVARLWNVKNVASHLLDGNIRMLSLSRDRHSVSPTNPIHNYHDLVNYLNTLNADWIKATDRISSTVLIDLLKSTGREYTDYVQTLPPMDDAIFSVAWAGEEVSRNWFHLAREYTEKWHHQQQIRDAVARPGIMTKELFYPFIGTLLRGLPFVFSNIEGEKNDCIQIHITSEIGGTWYLSSTEGPWVLSERVPVIPTAAVRIAPEVAWKLFTKGISASDADKMVAFEGNTALAANVLRLVAVMA